VGEETNEHRQVAELKVKKAWVDPDDVRLGQEREVKEKRKRKRVSSIYGSSRWVDVENEKEEERKDIDKAFEGPVIPEDWVDEDGDGLPDNKREAYVFSYDDNNPLQVTLTFNIQDRYLDAEELQDAMELLRFFSLLPMDDIPRIPVRDEGRQQVYRRYAFY